MAFILLCSALIEKRRERGTLNRKSKAFFGAPYMNRFTREKPLV